MLEQKDYLLKHLSQFNIYDLERLQKCFEYELTIRPQDANEIQDILNHIQKAIDGYNN